MVKQQEYTDTTATLGIESHTSDRWPLPFGPELSIEPLLWRPGARLEESRAVVEQSSKPPLLPGREPPALTPCGLLGTGASVRVHLIS